MTTTIKVDEPVLKTDELGRVRTPAALPPEVVPKRAFLGGIAEAPVQFTHLRWTVMPQY